MGDATARCAFYNVFHVLLSLMPYSHSFMGRRGTGTPFWEKQVVSWPRRRHWPGYTLLLSTLFVWFVTHPHSRAGLSNILVWSEHYQVTQPIKYCSCYAIASWNGLSDSSPQVHLFPTCRKHPALFRLASHLTQLPSSTRVYIPLLTLLQCFHHCGQVTYRHFPFPDNSCWTISSADSCVLSY